MGGPLSDYLTGVRLVQISIALSGISTFVFIISKDLLTFGAGMFLIALWSSFYHPTSNNLISKIFVTNTGGAMGVHGAAGSVGQMFTPSIAYLVGTMFSWRLAFVFFGVLSILTSLLVGSIRVEESKSMGGKPHFLEILRVPNLWLLLLFNVLVGLYYRGIELFFPTFLSLTKGFSGQLAAVSNSLVLSFGVVGQIIGGRTADAYGSTRVLLAASFGVLASLLFMLMLPLNIFGVVLFIVLYGVAYFGHQPAMTALVGVVSPKNLSGMAYGFMFFFAFGLGSISTTIAGYLADAISFEIAFWFMALISLVALIVAIAIQRKVHPKTIR